MSIHRESIQYDEPSENYFKVVGPYDTYDHEHNWLLEGFSVEYSNCSMPETFVVPLTNARYVLVNDEDFCHTDRHIEHINGHPVYMCRCENTGHSYRMVRNSLIGVCPYCNRPTIMDVDGEE